MSHKNNDANTNIMQLFLDIGALFIAYLIVYFIFKKEISNSQIIKTLSIVVVFSIIYILANKEARLYNVTLFFYIDRFWHIITKSWLIAATAMAAILFVLNSQSIMRTFCLVFLGVSYVLLCINIIFSRLLQQIVRTHHAPRIVFVGVFSEYQKFSYYLNKTNIKQEVLGYILRAEDKTEEKFNILGMLDELERIIHRNKVDQVYFMLKTTDKISEVQKYIDICLEVGVTAKVIIDTGAIGKANSYVSSVGTYPVITYQTDRQPRMRCMNIKDSIGGTSALNRD